jgi:adenylate cyclase
VVFVDVSGYTRRSQEAGDAAAAQQALLLADFVHGLAVPVGGRLVRSLGDGALAYFPDATRAVRFALDAVALAPANGIWNLHAGVNTGPMVRRDGDYYGTAVNIASRVADQASQDHVVVTRSVLDAWAGADAVSFTPIGSVSLKNVAEPVELYEAIAVAP